MYGLAAILDEWRQVIHLEILHKVVEHSQSLGVSTLIHIRQRSDFCSLAVKVSYA